MNPRLRDRLGWRNTIEAGASMPDDRAAMARAGFWFSAAGVALALLGIALPHSPEMNEGLLAAVAAVAAVMALLAVLVFDKLPAWTSYACSALATVLASAAVYAWDPGSFYGPLLYLWPMLYAFWFFSLRAALAQMALLAALFAGVLALEEPGYDPIAEWVATIGTLLSAGFFVSMVRTRLGAVVVHLTDAARRDPLTGLLNRRGFEDAFEVELERARRTEQSLSVIVGDLDRFKRINDHGGHAAGDDALRDVGALFSDSKRSWDSAARVGGEEFAILAPDTDEHGAYILAERARTAIESHFANGDDTSLTVSFGIVTYPTHGQSADSLLRAGDQALYAAKQLGRNRSVISSAEVPGILARGARGRRDSQVELATLLSLAEALDVRDAGSPSHCQRVGRYAELIARELGLPPEEIERVRIAGILHDIGRLAVPDGLLAKKGPLNEEEWHWVRSHPEVGARLLETTDFTELGEWILAHHERPDGTGYPEGRAGDEVPLEASILGVADAYEAMTASRPYRPPLDPEAASDELRRNAGRQFDERVVGALLRVV